MKDLTEEYVNIDWSGICRTSISTTVISHLNNLSKWTVTR